MARRPTLKELQRTRVVIEGLYPQIDGGRFPIKRAVGDPVEVTVDLFTDGHDPVTGDLLYRPAGGGDWRREPLRLLDNDRFTATFAVSEVGRYVYSVAGWVDHYAGWSRDLVKRRRAGQPLALHLETGARLLEATAARVGGDQAAVLTNHADLLRASGDEVAETIVTAPQIAAIMRANPEPQGVVSHQRELTVVVEPSLAACSAWYEFFPRSCGPADRHGTFADAEQRLDYVARLGFDIVYLPPVHPIGRSQRKGPNNEADAGGDVVGSPWAIGAEDGGHTALHPQLGDFDDFARFVGHARGLGLAIAIDLAFQCSPDHPWVSEHPEWFRHRPDGTIQFAENPPKQYQDIYPLDFDSPAADTLWNELLRVVRFWLARDIRIFRVDNPHTKPFAFWEWLISRVKRDHPDALFLAEAFTRPKVMHRLAKLGFSQSYTYFTWRTTKPELTSYFEELAGTPDRDYFRPNVWPNTPDILHEYLQHGGRPAFVIRLILAGTLAANYGIYGPAFELAENRPVRAGSEEYLDSEKYQLRRWDLARADSLADLIATLNRIRRAHRALQRDGNVAFHDIDNEQIIAYSRRLEGETLVVVVNLDFQHVQSGWLTLPLADLGLPADRPFVAHDLLTDARYSWNGASNYVALDPYSQPAHVCRLIDSAADDYAYPSFLS